MHKLLERQLKRHLGPKAEVPPEWMEFLEDVDRSYHDADTDRELMERSMDLASKELLERNEALAHQVAETERTANALRASQERYRRIVETASEGIWVVGAEGKTQLVNQRMAEMLGYRIDELESMHLFDLMEPDAAIEFEGRIEQLGADGGGTFDLRLSHKDGTRIWGLASLASITDPEGRGDGALFMITDITERKRTESDLRDAYQQLKELDAFRTQFINNAAHELGTPLTPLKIQLHVLKSALTGPLTDSQRRSLVTLERSVDRMTRLVKDLLDAARLQAARLELDVAATDLGLAIVETADAFEALAEEKGVSIELEDVDSIMVRADGPRIGQVLDNLVNNALKFTPEGGTITIRMERRPETAVVHVKDTGVGLKPADLSRLFKPFSQAEPGEGEHPGGTGLGLYICKGIIDAHVGAIWASSDGPGKGATFSFTLPLAHAAQAEMEEAAQPGSPEEADGEDDEIADEAVAQPGSERARA